MRRKTQFLQARQTGQRFRVAMIREGATPMTCIEAKCEQHEKGWMTVIDETSDLGQRQSQYIRAESGRRFVSFRSENPPSQYAALIAGTQMAAGLTVFIFYAGQRCFRDHADREVLFVHDKGDRRRVHANPRDFTEHFNEEAERAVTAARRG